MRSKTYEFNELSDSREIVEHNVPRFMLWFFYFILVALAFALIWSYFGTKEIVVQTSGIIKTEHTQSVIPLVNTKVTAIYFKEGDVIRKGDLLIELDGRSIEKDIENYTEALLTLESKLELEKLHLQSIDEGKNLFDISVLSHVTKYYEMRSYLEQLRNTRNKIEFRLTKKAEMDTLIKEQEETISRYSNEITKLNQQLESYRIHADFDGIIHFANPVLVGSSVVANQELIKVHQKQQNELLTAQFYVLNQDIAKVRIGQRVRIEIPALSVRTYGFAEAEVISIESDSRFDQSSGQSFYLVNAKLTSNQLSSDTKVEDIKIGMQVKGRMITDEQRYLFWAIEKLELWIFR